MPTDIASIARAVESAGFPFLTWAEWYPGGRPDSRWTKLVAQQFPATRHWVHHSVTSVLASPVSAARDINNIGIQRFGKMSYPFLIHHDGTVIQGCYPYIGAHTKNYNSTSLAGCNIGNYSEVTPTVRMVAANAALINALVSTGHYPSYNVPIAGHRDSPTASTACPGDFLYARLPDIRNLVGPPFPPPDPTPPDPPMIARPTVPTLFKRVSDGAALYYEDGKLLNAANEEIQAGANVAVVPVKPEGFTRVVKAFGPVIS